MQPATTLQELMAAVMAVVVFVLTTGTFKIEYVTPAPTPWLIVSPVTLTAPITALNVFLDTSFQLQPAPPVRLGVWPALPLIFASSLQLATTSLPAIAGQTQDYLKGVPLRALLASTTTTTVSPAELTSLSMVPSATTAKIHNSALSYQLLGSTRYPLTQQYPPII